MFTLNRALREFAQTYSHPADVLTLGSKILPGYTSRREDFSASKFLDTILATPTDFHTSVRHLILDTLKTAVLQDNSASNYHAANLISSMRPAITTEVQKELGKLDTVGNFYDEPTAEFFSQLKSYSADLVALPREVEKLIRHTAVNCHLKNSDLSMEFLAHHRGIPGAVQQYFSNGDYSQYDCVLDYSVLGVARKLPLGYNFQYWLGEAAAYLSLHQKLLAKINRDACMNGYGYLPYFLTLSDNAVLGKFLTFSESSRPLVIKHSWEESYRLFLAGGQFDVRSFVKNWTQVLTAHTIEPHFTELIAKTLIEYVLLQELKEQIAQEDNVRTITPDGPVYLASLPEAVLAYIKKTNRPGAAITNNLHLFKHKVGDSYIFPVVRMAASRLLYSEVDRILVTVLSIDADGNIETGQVISQSRDINIDVYNFPKPTRPVEKK